MYLRIRCVYLQILKTRLVARCEHLILWIHRWQDSSDPLNADRWKRLSTYAPVDGDAAAAGDGDAAAAELDGSAAHNDHEPRRAGIPDAAVHLPLLARSHLRPRSIKLRLKPYA